MGKSRRVSIVDIGTEWNLKKTSSFAVWMPELVDIGTEWNLKAFYDGKGGAGKAVDIGTEWNLKLNIMSLHER